MFDQLFSLPGFFTLLMLVLLQAVLGFDNLLYISIESKRVAPERQSYVRKMGIGLAVFFRIGLLFIVVNLIKRLEAPFFSFETTAIGAQISGHAVIVLLGGAFILWTAIKEIYHMLAEPDLHAGEAKPNASVAKTIALIVAMNLVFSFDSILSALALSDDMAILTTAIVIGGLLMIFLADRVADFLAKNRMYEVLGLFVLFIVGIMLISDGGHEAHVHLFTYNVEPMTKSTFYFVLIVLIIVDVVQSQYQKKLLARKAASEVKPTAG